MQLFFNILVATFLYLNISLSFTIIFYPTKSFSIVHAALITVAAYLMYFFTIQLNFSLTFSIPMEIIIPICLGLLIDIFIYRPLRRKKTSSLLILIASLGLYVVFQNCISLFWGDNTKIIRTGEVKVGNEIFDAYITNIQIITICVSIFSFILTLIFLKYHKIGRNIRAVAANAELARVQGINSDKIILWSIGVGSGLGAVVGILVAADTGMTPTMGFNLLLYGVVVMIIGGVGSTWGLIGGALLLASAQHLTAYFIDSKWMNAVTYFILIIFLIWKPLGFSGKHLKKIEI
jgi:branched-chain amino acid transport system permease protein